MGNFFEQQAVFDVFVTGVPSVRATVGDVRNLLLDTSNGGHVRLGQIANVSIHADPIDIEHDATSRYVNVTAPLRSGSVANAQEAIRRGLDRISYPLTYHAEIQASGNPFAGTSHGVFLTYVLAALLGMLLLAQAAFRSWGLALAFIVSLPIALAGGVVVALATGEIRALGADAGLLAVLAIAARQAMLQIAGFRRVQARDGGPLTAGMVQEGAAQRLAPSLAALAVTAVAMLPFVIEGNVAGNEITHVSAAVILGGLVSTLLLTQLVLPALCVSLGLGGQHTPDESLEGPELERPAILAGSAASEPVAKGASR